MAGNSGRRPGTQATTSTGTSSKWSASHCRASRSASSLGSGCAARAGRSTSPGGRCGRAGGGRRGRGRPRTRSACGLPDGRVARRDRAARGRVSSSIGSVRSRRCADLRAHERGDRRRRVELGFGGRIGTVDRHESRVEACTARELAPERVVAAVLEAVGHVAGAPQLGVQLRAGAPSGRRRRRGARGASRCGTEPGRSGRRATACTGVRREPAVLRPLHAAVLGDRAQAVDHAPDGQIRREPEDEVDPRVVQRDADRDEHELASRRWRGPGMRTAASVGSRRAEEALEELPAGLARSRRGRACGASSRARSGSRGREGCRARRGRTRRGGAPCGRAGTRSIGVNDGKPSSQRPTKSLTLAVAEQQPVRGLVHERRELRVGAAHEQERGDPDEPVVGERQWSKWAAMTTMAIVCA